MYYKSKDKDSKDVWIWPVDRKKYRGATIIFTILAIFFVVILVDFIFAFGWLGSPIFDLEIIFKFYGGQLVASLFSLPSFIAWHSKWIVKIADGYLEAASTMRYEKIALKDIRSVALVERHVTTMFSGSAHPVTMLSIGFGHGHKVNIDVSASQFNPDYWFEKFEKIVSNHTDLEKSESVEFTQPQLSHFSPYGAMPHAAHILGLVAPLAGKDSSTLDKKELDKVWKEAAAAPLKEYSKFWMRAGSIFFFTCCIAFFPLMAMSISDKYPTHAQFFTILCTICLLTFAFGVRFLTTYLGADGEAQRSYLRFCLAFVIIFISLVELEMNTIDPIQMVMKWLIGLMAILPGFYIFCALSDVRSGYRYS